MLGVVTFLRAEYDGDNGAENWPTWLVQAPTIGALRSTSRMPTVIWADGIVD